MYLREELRRRFVKAETTLFKVRYGPDESEEKLMFLNSRDFDWVEVCSIGHTSVLRFPITLSCIIQASSDEVERFRDQLDLVPGAPDKGAQKTYYKVGYGVLLITLI